jgi:hypothetical protein
MAQDHTKCEAIAKAAAVADGWRHKGILLRHPNGSFISSKRLQLYGCTVAQQAPNGDCP